MALSDTPVVVAAAVGGACLVALTTAIIDSGALQTATTTAGSMRAGTIGDVVWIGLTFLVLIVAGLAMDFHQRGVMATGAVHGGDPSYDESNIRQLLRRWYPDWTPQHRSVVASTIRYHRRRMRDHD